MSRGGNTPAQLEARRANMRKARQLDGMKVLHSIGHDGGLWSWESSPHVLWLATVLGGIEYPLTN